MTFMNLKTTIVLLLLAGAGVGAWAWWHSRQPQEVAASPTLAFFEANKKGDRTTRIEVSRRPTVVELPFVVGSTIGMLTTPLGQGTLPARAIFYPRTPQTLFVLEKTAGEWHLPGNW